MTMNPLPPQAYTKDILLKAYSWLMSQSRSIKEMATTPDILVSLYLKATRDGDSALDRPSITNFKAELKSLAGLLGELDKAPSIPSTIPMPEIQESITAAPLMPPPHGATHNHGQNSAQNHSQKFNTAPTHSAAAGTGPSLPLPQTPEMMASSTHFDIDPASLVMIREVKEEMNLSCDSEALRMLIKVGYNRSKTLNK